MTDLSVYERCWCWQYGRCLVECPTANHPRPRPLTDAAWKAAAYALMGKADCACGIRTSASKDGRPAQCLSCRAMHKASCSPAAAVQDNTSRGSNDG